MILILRLRSVLGKRVGLEKTAPRVQLNTATRVTPKPSIPTPLNPIAALPNSELAAKLADITKLDRGFDPSVFLENATSAFRIVVTAFAAGDLPTLQNLTTAAVLANFEAAISTRNSVHETQSTTVKDVKQKSIEDAQISGAALAVKVRFVSDQINYVSDQSGQIMHGSEAIIEMSDLWTFEKNLADKNDPWRLASTQHG